MINKAILMGRLTRDVELRHTNSGKAVASFTVAIDNGYGENKTTDFINCTAWGKTAEFVEKYFSKGRMIIVTGRLQSRSWEGQDGKKNYAVEVVAAEVSFGESKREAEGGEGSGGRRADEGIGPYDGGRGGGASGSDDFLEIPDDGDLPWSS